MIDALESSLKKAFIDHTANGSTFDPNLIINQPDKKQFLLSTIQNELLGCQEFFFSIAFITQDGLNGLKTQLADLHLKGIGGKILTSTYLFFNQPEMFISLLQIPNVQVRISTKKGFHAKGYLFKYHDFSSFIIGSSNLTMSALKVNYEWNVRLTSYEHGEMIQQLNNYLDQEWQISEPLTLDWIESYKKQYHKQNQTILSVVYQTDTVSEDGTTFITPNKMQKKALTQIQELRNKGANRELIISATGTGKTYLAAFDVKEVNPKRLLFIAHREQILNSAKESFKKILGGSPTKFGVLSGTKKDLEADYLFATIQTLAKKDIQQLFDPKHFDYIIIDEVHKAGANSYISTIDYFKPNFLLGMTATPERTDGFNIFELFDYNIAYEIRLPEALEEDMLCPFYYYGVTDYEKENQLISETTDLSYLVSDERVDFLINKINYYGSDKNMTTGLVFCRSKDESSAMAKAFNERNIPSISLTGDQSIGDREDAIQQLEEGIISYIFTVDIFNEGIDIPKINQIVMLRNTESNIIFIQQLGRGLRKSENKNFVTIIDFIGNYKNNYMIPMALADDATRNKNNLRRDTFETNYLSGISAINFEEIAKERIYSSINQAKLDNMMALKKIFIELQNRINRVPLLTDFQKSNMLDPSIITTKYTSYYDFLCKIKKAESKISENENKLLQFFGRELLSGIRKQEIVLLQILQIKQTLTLSEVKILFKENDLISDEKTIRSVINILTIKFYTGSQKNSYQHCALIEQDATGNISLSTHLKNALNNNYFSLLFKDLITTSLIKSDDFLTNEPLTLYKKYRRRDVLRNLCWQEQLVDQNIGGYTYHDGQFVIFVRLNKGANFKGAEISYEDALLDNSTLQWFTKAPRTVNSPEVLILKDSIDYKIHLFVQKSDDEGIDFYYLGEVSANKKTIKQVTRPNEKGIHKNLVEMTLVLKQPIEYKLYNYLL